MFGAIEMPDRLQARHRRGHMPLEGLASSRAHRRPRQKNQSRASRGRCH
jgi:hypothetical protein